MLARETLEKICFDFLPQWYSQDQLEQLLKFARKEEIEATKNYDKLEEPKTSDLDTYVKIWVWESLHKREVGKQITKIDVSEESENPLGRAIFEYRKVNPEGLAKKLEIHKVFVDHQQRNTLLTQAIEKFGINILDAESKFKDIIKSRNELADQNGNTTQINQSLQANGISWSEFEFFRQNVDQVIQNINSNLPDNSNLPEDFYAELNFPCFICLMKDFPNWNKEGLNELLIGKYPILERFTEKISYERGDGATMAYDLKNDRFNIRINTEDNFRHQSLSVLHEFCHVVDYLESSKVGDVFQRNTKLYAEKKVLDKELGILKETSKELYRAFLGTLLSDLRILLFEIEMYENPDQDLSKLYATAFNRCYMKTKPQLSSFLYLFNDQLVIKPLSNLPHMVALVSHLASYKALPKIHSITDDVQIPLDEPSNSKYFVFYSVKSKESAKHKSLKLTLGEEKLLASKVSPGETLRDVIRRDMFDLTGTDKFVIKSVEREHDTANDKFGRELPRAAVHLEVDYFDPKSRQTKHSVIWE